MICPRCEQGNILKANIIATGQPLMVCNECEATWLAADLIGPSGFVDFGTYMESLGLRPLWDELELIRA